MFTVYEIPTMHMMTEMIDEIVVIYQFNWIGKRLFSLSNHIHFLTAHFPRDAL